MGWSSGGGVFDPVAQVLTQIVAIGGISEAHATEILSTLISGLQSRGWDTEGESLGMFKDYPWAVTAFARNDIYDNEDEE